MILLVPLAFLAALAVASHAGLPWRLAYAGVVPFGAGLCVLILGRRMWLVTLGLAALACALGLIRLDLESRLRPSSSLSEVMAREGLTALRGMVTEPPVPRDRAQIVRLRVDAARLPDGTWVTTNGAAQITVPPEPPLSFGDVLEVRGKVKLPEDGAPAGYAAALRRQGIDAALGFPAIVHLGQEAPDSWRAALFAVRARASAAIESVLPEPQAALVEGILAGQRASIPKDLTDELNRSGTSHVVAVSGYNVSIVVGAVAAVLGGARWRRSGSQVLVAVLASAALWLFVALVGPAGSVLRAAAMAQLALVGRALGRRGSAGGLLLWGSAFLAAWQPAIVLDVGWQLSFLGTAGLVWLSPMLSGVAARWPTRVPNLVLDSLATTLAAQVCVLPVMAGVFGRASVVAPLANLLVLPLVPPIMLGGALVVTASAVLPAAAPLFAGLTWVAASALIWAVRWCASLPHAAVSLPPWPWPTVVGYLSGLTILLLVSEQGRWAGEHAGTVTPSVGARTGWGGKLGGLALACLVGLVCLGWAMAPAVEAGEAPVLVVQAPAVQEGTLLVARAAGTRVLVNGGPTTSGAVAALGESLRPWDRTIDLALLTDPREAYVLGLPRVVERYRVGLLLDAANDYPSAAYRAVRDVTTRRGVPRLPAEVGTEVVIGPALTLEVLGQVGVGNSQASERTGSRPSASGAEPLAFRLRSGDFSVLLPLDGTAAQSRALLAGEQSLASTVVVLTDHATRQPGAEALLRAASPELVVVQGAAKATGSAPPAEPVTLLVGDGEPEPTWYRTQADGALRLEVRGDGYRVVVSH